MGNYRILFCGDTLLKSKGSVNPFHYVFPILKHYDLVIVNLETVITDRLLPAKEKSVVLRTASKNLDYLSDVRKKLIFSLANNHILDYGKEGYCDTVSNLRNKGFRFVPLDKPLRLWELTLYSTSPSIKNSFQEKVISGNHKFDNSSVNIVIIHWGEEHVMLPSPRQVSLAKDLISKGVNLIVGSHPHVPQPLGKISDIPVAFSLGNFNFTQFDIRPTLLNHLGYMLGVDIQEAKIYNVKKIWYKVNSELQPVPLTSSCSRKLDMIFQGISEKITVNFTYWLGYMKHSSYIYLRTNLVGGCLPRLRKYGLRHLPPLLKWLFHPKTILRVPFVFVKDDSVFREVRSTFLEATSLISQPPK